MTGFTNLPYLQTPCTSIKILKQLSSDWEYVNAKRNAAFSLVKEINAADRGFNDIRELKHILQIFPLLVSTLNVVPVCWSPGPEVFVFCIDCFQQDEAMMCNEL